MHQAGTAGGRRPWRRALALALVVASAVGLPAAAEAGPAPTAAPSVGPATASAAAPGTRAQAAPAAPEATSASGQGDPSVADQMEAIADDKASRTPAEQKVDSNLLYAVQEDATGVAVEGAPELRSTVTPDAGSVLVDIDAEVTPALLRSIATSGGSVVASVPAYGAVRAEVPLDAVVTLAGRGEVAEVRPADEATTNRVAGDAATSSAGSAASEADVVHGADTVRADYALDGAGVKVCVLSDGVDSLALRQGSGDLPAVDVVSGQEGTGDEGTAMLELIHDIAPGAGLGFASGFNGQASFAQNIVALRASGCGIIVDDITYFAEPTMQDGPVAQAISTVRAQGATYFTSAGNGGNLADGTSGTWQGDFQDAGASAAPLPTGMRVHGWGHGVGYNAITATGGQLNLQWSDPVGASANDYDLYLLNSDGTAITSSSTNIQSGTQNPAESISTSPVGGRVVVTKKAAAASRYLVLYTNRGRLAYGTGGSVRGHNASVDAVSVAATPAAAALNGSSPTGPYPGLFTSSSVSEVFSSDGPVRQYFTPSGAAITPGNLTATGGVARNAVDLTAADGITTATAGYNPFFGTSAAAPDAAALAALALEAKPSLTPGQLEAAMAASALDIEAAGVDPDTGAGIVMARALLVAVGATGRAKLAAGTTTITPQAGDGDGFVEPGETATVSTLLTNAGVAPATGITATLTSDSADATVIQGTTSYGPIAPGATGSPTGTPLRIAVAPGCACGATLSLTLTVSYAGGSQPAVELPVRVVVGQPAAVDDVAYRGGVVAVPDKSAAGGSASVSVASTALIQGLTVTIGGRACSAASGSTTVGIDHSYVGDLTLSLTSPHGTTAVLMARAGESGNNLCQTVFSDASDTPIQDQPSTAAPFTGTFRPATPLSAFDGEDPHGTWTLKAVDSASGDTGSIRAFSLQLAGSTCARASTGEGPPVATADSYAAVSGRALTVAAPGVLANDTDPGGHPLTASIVTGAQHGLVALRDDGSFTYTATAGYSGPDFFAYRAFDGTDLSDTVLANIQVATPTQAYVAAVYRDFLSRTADAGGQAYWSGRLDTGKETRASFVLKMSRSHEYSVKIVTRAFTDVLGRTPDPSGREYWADRVQAGMPIATLVLNLTASNEYLGHTGGTTTGFVDATFQAIFGRVPSTGERASWVAKLDGGTSRLSMAKQLYATNESRRRRVTVQYVDLLRRQPTAAELSAGVAQLATSSDIRLAIALGSSDEYYAAALVR
ncbi:DUF4214 domain-containing protein [Aquihabitans sp. McL0605]|uniref:DUF4214 domain-containing protein n=1 Tax=Aquihabitans sp. McL0605 TaxID=3415671 RepID=UPI003CE6EC66